MQPLLWAGLAALAGCCAPLTDRVILLPGQDGGSGAVSVKAARGELVLAEPYAQADVVGGEIRPLTSSAQAVQNTYGQLLEMQPPRPRVFIVNFEFDSDKLTAESEPVLQQALQALAALTGGEIVLIGHTDRLGSIEWNDRLSLQRAQAVRERLLAAGAAPERIVVVGRGEREPLVPTADEVAEPRNRRVEIKLR